MAATEPTRSNQYLISGLALILIVALLVLPAFGERLGIPTWSGIALVAGLLAALILVGQWSSRRQRRLRQALSLAEECAQLQEWNAVPSILEEVLTHPVRSSLDRAEAFLMFAGAAEDAGRYDTAAAIYEAIALRQLGSVVQVRQAQISLAAVKIRNQELTDAVNLLARLESVDLPPNMKAGLDLVRLFQQIYMGHCADAVQNLETRRDLYRRFLSTQAGYGYALLAYAFRAVGSPDLAARWWLDATLLVPADRLIKEHELLAPLAHEYPAAERPL